jgi:RNA polymerase sigma factor FliA
LERERLLQENLPEVRYIARWIYDRLPPHVPFDDLVHAGILGLIDAVDKFDPKRNVQLKSYARFRIRGAILDSLRQMDWSPRSLRRQARRIEDRSRTQRPGNCGTNGHGAGRIPATAWAIARPGFRQFAEWWKRR